MDRRVSCVPQARRGELQSWLSMVARVDINETVRYAVAPFVPAQGFAPEFPVILERGNSVADRHRST